MEREREREKEYPERETDKRKTRKAVLNNETKCEWPWQARNEGRYSIRGRTVLRVLRRTTQHEAVSGQPPAPPLSGEGEMSGKDLVTVCILEGIGRGICQR